MITMQGKHMPSSVISELKKIDQNLFSKLHQSITKETLFRYLKPVADTYAPLQTTSWTRAAVLENLLIEDGYLNNGKMDFIRNYENTGNTVVLLGRNKSKQVWLLAHLDQISYLIEDDLGDHYSLLPMCYHLMEPGKRKAIALAYDLDSNTYKVVDKGIIHSKNKEEIIYLPGDKEKLSSGTQICFDSQLTWEKQSGLLKGSLDDSAGAVALLLAVRYLAYYDVDVMLGLTDEEEGLAGIGNQTFCRGGARLLRYFDQPDLVIASDIHEAAEMYGGDGPDGFNIGDGASFAEKSSSGLGAVTPPHIYEIMKKMAVELSEEGIQLRENVGGYLSRTESINAMYRTPNVSLVGFLGKNRHFQSDVESASINDLVNLSKSIVCLVLLTQTDYWKTLVMKT